MAPMQAENATQNYQLLQRPPAEFAPNNGGPPPSQYQATEPRRGGYRGAGDAFRAGLDRRNQPTCWYCTGAHMRDECPHLGPLIKEGKCHINKDRQIAPGPFQGTRHIVPGLVFPFNMPFPERKKLLEDAIKTGSIYI